MRHPVSSIAWILKILDGGSDIPKMDQTFFYRSFILMAGVTRKENSLGIFGATFHEYDRQRPAGLEHFDPAMISQILNEAGRDYLTACQNCVVLNMTSRARKAFRAFLDNLDGNEMRAPDKHELCNHYVRRMSRETRAVDEAAVWDSLRDVEDKVKEKVSAKIQLDEERYGDLPLDGTDRDRETAKKG